MKGVQYTPYERHSLQKAVCDGRIERVREIISSRSLYYSQEWSDASDGYALLCTAVKEKHTEIAKLLLTNGYKVNSKNENLSETPLHFAVINDDIEIVQMLLHKGANIDAKNSSGYTPLHIAVKMKLMKIKIIDILLNEDACFEVPNGIDVTHLDIAALLGSEEMIKTLLSKGANVNAETKDGMTSLHLATQIGQLKIVEHLLKYGANVNAVYKTSGSEEDYVPLHLAARNDNKEIMQSLFSQHANVNAEAKDGITSFHIALKHRCEQIAEQLLKYGANVNAVFNISGMEEGYTPLHLAAENGHQDIIELLLKFGASVNSTDEYGLTALHIASKNGRKEIVSVLLEHGSDTTIMSKQNYTALDFAMYPHKAFGDDYMYSNYGHVNVVKILKRHMVKIKAANLYAVNKHILSISSATFGSDAEELSGFQNECEKEIASMKSEVINDNITLYDILIGSVRLLARYATNESIVKAFGSDNYKIKFPIYASMIKWNFRKGEKEKEFMEKGDKIFGFLSKNLPSLPPDCTEKILSYLNYEDLI